MKIRSNAQNKLQGMNTQTQPISFLLKVKHIKHHGNVSFEEVINIARIMRPRSMAKTLKGTVKEILGTANSVGCSIEGKSPIDMQEAVENGEVEVPEE